MPAAKPACAESWKPSMTVGVNYCTKLLEWNHNRMSTRREETKQRTHEIPTTWGRPERLGEWSNKRVSKVVDFSCCLEDLFCINCWSFAKPQEWRATRKTFWFCPCAKNKKRFLLTQRFQALSVPLQPSFVEGLAQLHEACKFQLTDLAPVQPNGKDQSAAIPVWCLHWCIYLYIDHESSTKPLKSLAMKLISETYQLADYQIIAPSVCKPEKHS